MPQHPIERTNEPVALRENDILTEQSTPGVSELLASLAEEDARRFPAAYIFVAMFSLFWIGAAVAFLWGYLGPERLLMLEPHLVAFAVIITFLPPFLFVASAFALERAVRLTRGAERMAVATQNLLRADDAAVASAHRLGRAVRHELDALSSGVDGAMGRLRSMETAFEERIAQLDEAVARAGVKTETIAAKLGAERDGIEKLGEQLGAASTSAAELLAGRAAQLRALIEAAGGELKAAGQTLETQSKDFSAAAEKAATAPHQAAEALDRQARAIETIADNVVGRAEFVLARQERQRVAMNELLVRLKDDAAALDAALAAQASSIVRATEMLAEQATKLDSLAAEGIQRLDQAMVSADARTAQLAAGFMYEADKIKAATESTAEAMARIVDSMREAGVHTEALVAESTANAKKNAMTMVGEAMGQCDHLLRAAATVADQAEKARAALTKAAEEAERHIIALPGIAAQEAQRVRDTLKRETEQMLDISARTLATLHHRKSIPSAAGPDRALQLTERDIVPADDDDNQSLRGLARRFTGKKKKDIRNDRGYELSAVLAAAENAEPRLKPNVAAALAALQAGLADLAIDLDQLMTGLTDQRLWRRYLDGDRAAFAHHLASTIGPDTVDRIAGLYRDHSRFHSAADAYIAEYEMLLAKAKESDRDGLLASTLLSADTGKIYLAIAYALGRLD